MLPRYIVPTLCLVILSASCSTSDTTQAPKTEEPLQTAQSEPTAAPALAEAKTPAPPVKFEAPQSSPDEELLRQMAELRRELDDLRQRRQAGSPVARTTASASDATRRHADQSTAYGVPSMSGVTSLGTASSSASWQAEIPSTRPASVQRPDRSPTRAVKINGRPIDAAKLLAFETLHGVRLPDGSYWYDRHSGALGVFGGPCTGYARAGLDFGGPMPANCSGGGTGVFVNGRELHRMEVLLLSQVATVYRGRYTLDSAGNVGIEGGPFLYNVFQVGQQMMAQQQRQGGGGGGSSWSHSGIFGHTGGDGETFYFLDGDSSYISGQ
ncbi:MAG: hypothetical protein RL885_18955 [Planctomycetota bacterium]